MRGLRTLTLVALAVAAMAVAPAAIAAPADTITLVERQIDINPGETNPCTGATGTIIDDEQDVFHITSLADGGLHLNGHSTVVVTFLPDDPNGVRYEGHETFAFSENSASATFTTSMTTMVRVKGSDGTFITFRDVAHLTVTATGVVVSVDRPTLLCP
jgi:hypothetical protein